MTVSLSAILSVSAFLSNGLNQMKNMTPHRNHICDEVLMPICVGHLSEWITLRNDFCGIQPSILYFRWRYYSGHGHTKRVFWQLVQPNCIFTSERLTRRFHWLMRGQERNSHSYLSGPSSVFTGDSSFWKFSSTAFLPTFAENDSNDA